MEKGVKRETPCMENKIRNNGGKHAGMHKPSQAISKMKPKIRIIHIFAPQIIHTDVHNFRHLVQTLTGKPTPPQKATQESTNNGVRLRDQAVKMELTNGFLGLDLHQSRPRERLVIKEEEDEQGFYDREISSGGYLRGLEGFISEFGHFPFSPNWDAYHHRQTQDFEDTLLIS